MVNRYEVLGIFACIGLMAVALFFIRLDETNESLTAGSNEGQSASVVTATGDAELGKTLARSLSDSGELTSLVIDDIIIGDGETVTKGDTVTVDYIGTLQNGEQFDNSYVRGTPFTFTVGEGRVIQGWEQGVIGMKVGGQRILIIPPALAYGASSAGPIPAHATLVFAVELLSKE